MRDTIFAPATAAGRSAVAVVRVSGPQAGRVVSELCGRLPSPRMASLRRLRSGGEFLDEALVLWMPGPSSFTGEDAAELQTHGGTAVVDAVCRALHAAGARPAEAGEFTRRAFEAGRLDLAQAEAVADLVDAETDGQRRQATAQLSGALSQRYDLWREKLLDALALLEAGIDFPEDDVPDGIVSDALPLIRSVSDEIGAELGDLRGERVRRGVRVALLGAPNVGKSSLLNALAGRDAAIVTAIPGTTRDVVEVYLDLGGQAVVLADMAGIREADDPIEAEGVARARRWSDQADLRIVVADATRPDTATTARRLIRGGDLLVANKIDLVVDPQGREGAPSLVSHATELGVQGLRTALQLKIEQLTVGITFPAVTRQRHRELLSACRSALDEATISLGAGAELIGESVRLALRELERITGRSDPEAVLERVFGRFCIGK